MEIGLTHASLFSGIGGFDLAAEQIGWTNLFHCEWNPFCKRILDYHFPNSKSYADIKQTDFREWRGRVDVLTGGFPCQPFSVAGQRKGSEDDRYLWPQMLRAIKEIRPTWIVGENVAGLLSMVQPGEETTVESYKDLFGESHTLCEEHSSYILHGIICDLEDRGYAVQTFIVPACAVGAPHRRDRIWIVAHANDSRVEGARPEGKNETDISNVVAHANGLGWGKGGAESQRQKEEATKRANLFINDSGSCLQRSATHADSASVTGQCDGQSGQGQPNRCHRYNLPTEKAQRGWSNFPTQSPVCGGDDGIPRTLDSITFSKWRSESVTAYGNAIVPEVALRIFRAIDKITKDDH